MRTCGGLSSMHKPVGAPPWAAHAGLNPRGWTCRVAPCWTRAGLAHTTCAQAGAEGHGGRRPGHPQGRHSAVSATVVLAARSTAARPGCAPLLAPSAAGSIFFCGRCCVAPRRVCVARMAVPSSLAATHRVHSGRRACHRVWLGCACLLRCSLRSSSCVRRHGYLHSLAVRAAVAHGAPTPAVALQVQQGHTWATVHLPHGPPEHKQSWGVTSACSAQAVHMGPPPPQAAPPSHPPEHGHSWDSMGGWITTHAPRRLHTWSIHRSKRAWGEDAEEFKPERWSSFEGKQGGSSGG